MMRKAAERNRALEAAWIFLAVIVLGLVIVIRIRLLGIPLERDEGGYAYYFEQLPESLPQLGAYVLIYQRKS